MSLLKEHVSKEPLTRSEILKYGVLEIKNWFWENLQTPFWRIMWNMEKGWSVSSDQCKIELGPEKFVIIPPAVRFSAKGVDTNTHLFMEFELSENSLHKSIIQSQVKPSQRDEIQGIIDGFSNAQQSTLDLKVHALVLNILANVGAEFKSKSLDPRIAQACEILRNTSGERIDNSILASQVHMSTNAFIRLFSQQIGLAPARWHLENRIEKACKLLRYTKQSIERIGLETGFCDRYHFSRVFKQKTGLTPKEFQRL